MWLNKQENFVQEEVRKDVFDFTFIPLNWLQIQRFEIWIQFNSSFGQGNHNQFQYFWTVSDCRFGPKHFDIVLPF